MNSHWETEEEKLIRFMKIPPKKKLEWLYQMHQLLTKAWTKKKKHDYFKLREAR